MDVLALNSKKTGKINYIGKNSWIELLRRLPLRDDRHFALYDDTSPFQAASLLRKDTTQSVIIEGMQNHPDMRVCDLDLICDAAASAGSEKVIVVDNTATFNTNFFRQIPNCNSGFSLLSVISGIKFLQSGSDAEKAGFLHMRLADCHSGMMTALIEARAGSGKAPSFAEVFACNSDTTLSLESRIQRYDRNNQKLASDLDAFARATGLITVSSPWLSSHPDHERAMRVHGHGGRFMYITLGHPRDRTGEATLALYRMIADEARTARLPLIAASSFGFSLPHIHVVRHEERGLSLRVSAGSVDWSTVIRLSKHVQRCIALALTPRMRAVRS